MDFILLQSHNNGEILEDVEYNIYQNQNIISDQFGALHFIWSFQLDIKDCNDWINS